MKKLTPKYQKRLRVLWAIEAVIILYNVFAPSFETMALPMAGCWLYVMACAAREGLGFENAFSQRYPHACREWKEKRWGQYLGKRMGPCPMPGDPDLRARWEDLRSVNVFAGRVFTGFGLLFFALLGRMLLFGPYE